MKINEKKNGKHWKALINTKKQFKAKTRNGKPGKHWKMI
jgi:hypothetical protein